MLNSIFLESYSPLIIVLNSIAGFLLLEKGVITKKIDIIGGFLLFTGLLIYTDRLLKPSLTTIKKILIPVLLGLIYLVYLTIIYLIVKKYDKTKFIFYFLLFGLLIAFGWSVTNDKIDSENTQYVFGSILGILIALFFMIPMHRKKGEIFSLSLVLLSLSLTVLVFSSIVTPVTEI